MTTTETDMGAPLLAGTPAAIGAAAWIAAGPLPPDQAPPADLPEWPMGPGWTARPILAHLADLAARQPAAPALDDGARRLSYAELYAAACRVGAALRRAGWPKGAVGVLVPNDARYVQAMLGCLAAGRPCMMLGPHLPAPYLAGSVAAAGLVGVIATPALAALLGDAVPVLDVEHAMATPEADTPLLLDPDAPAFIAATSGSTGLPKAVARSQRAMLANYEPRIRHLRIGPHDGVAVTGAPATAGALSHRFYALVAGARLVLLDPHALGLGGALRRIGDAGATVLHATPLLLRALAGLPAAAASFARLRLAMMGADALLHADLPMIRRALPRGCRVQYSLSLSESSRVANWFVPEHDGHDPVRVAVGYLVDGVEAAVLDEGGHPVPPGEAGELVVRTPLSASGDWVAGRVVAARFPTDPADPGRRIVHTGDIVRFAPDGVLVVLGRRDRMVKIAGQRVEPATVELAMRAVPGVADAAVVALRQRGVVRLAGFVAPAPDAPEDLLGAVKAALRVALPAAMVPALLRRIDAVPLTRAGKRDDAALAVLASA